MIRKFEEWMMLNTNLSDSSVSKYSSAVNTISVEMIDNKIIQKSIFNMQLLELDSAMFHIFNCSIFVEKNSKGNNMYSYAIKYYRGFVSDSVNIFEDTDEPENIAREKLQLIKTRIGQSKYRAGLLEKFNNTCVITGINITKLLVASHIKPWSVCNDIEKIDIDNGLLLSANMDKLFDSGMITFQKDGSLKISSCISDCDRAILGLNNNTKIELNDKSKIWQYMEYHREFLFIK